jgi:hypothetical protein
MQQGVSDSEDDDGMPELVPDESDSDVSESVPGFLPDESDLEVSEALPGLDDTCSDESSYEASTDTKLASPATDGDHIEVWTMQVPFSLPTATMTPVFLCVLFQHFFHAYLNVAHPTAVCHAIKGCWSVHAAHLDQHEGKRWIV